MKEGRKMMRKFGWLLLVIAIISSLLVAGCAGEAPTPAPTPAPGEAIVITDLLTVFGAPPLERDTIFANYVARAYPELIIRPQETTGYIYNIKEMASHPNRWTNTYIGNNTTMPWLAENGVQPFFEEPIIIDWKWIEKTEVAVAGRCFVTLDPNIKTLADAKGKTIGIGLRAQTEFAVIPLMIFEHGYGITEENTHIEYLGSLKAAEALLDGRVDVALYAGGANVFGTMFTADAGARLLEGSGRDLYFLGVSEEALAKVEGVTGLEMNPAVFPPGFISAQQTEPVPTGAGFDGRACHPEFPEEIAYKLVKAVAEIGPQLSEFHAFWKMWCPEQMLYGLTEENTHPGAVRAYKELGWWDKYEGWRLKQEPLLGGIAK